MRRRGTGRCVKSGLEGGWTGLPHPLPLVTMVQFGVSEYRSTLANGPSNISPFPRLCSTSAVAQYVVALCGIRSVRSSLSAFLRKCTPPPPASPHFVHQMVHH